MKELRDCLVAQEPRNPDLVLMTMSTLLTLNVRLGPASIRCANANSVYDQRP